MKKYFNNLYSEKTPLIFTDGTSVYQNLAKEYKIHKKGLFIYGPSGVGKTYFINNQKEKNWLDGDTLWSLTNAFPSEEWWNWEGEEIDKVERRADIITEQAKKLGFWIIGASSVNVIPDAIVIPDLETHLKYIKFREENNYDGGITSVDLTKIKRNRKYYARFKKNSVPIFLSVEEAVNYLESQMDE